jgi:hydrogenase maturation protease
VSTGSARSRRLVVIGVGHRDRADDGIGPAVVEALGRRFEDVVTLVREGDLAVLPLLWEPDDDVVIIDVIVSAGPIGELSEIDPDHLELSSGMSTHGLNVADAVQLARRLEVPDVERNPFRSIIIRALEVLIAVLEAQRIVDRYVEPNPSFGAVTPVAGTGWGASEAPRGVLLHRYETDSDGTITDARIIPPTAQNQAAIEADIRRVVEQHLQEHPVSGEEADHELQHRCETAVRNHDPCISCATHFLTVDVQRSHTSGPAR